MKSNAEKTFLQVLEGSFSFPGAVVPDYIGNKNSWKLIFCLFVLIFAFIIWL